MRDANLRSADLEYARLEYANLTGARLEYARLEYANLTDANLANANLRNADLRDVTMNWSSHNLVSERLRQAAGQDVSRRMFAGLIAVSTDWCWEDFNAHALPLDLTEWTLRLFVSWRKENDDVPDFEAMAKSRGLELAEFK